MEGLWLWLWRMRLGDGRLFDLKSEMGGGFGCELRRGFARVRFLG